MSQDITTTHFEFRNWLQAKRHWEKLQPLYEGYLQFVQSTHPYSSGYWIEEKGKEVTKFDRVMTTNGSVQQFFRDLKKHIDKIKTQ